MWGFCRGLTVFISMHKESCSNPGFFFPWLQVQLEKHSPLQLPQLCVICFTFPSLSEFSKEDMAKSLLHMISNDIGQLACLYAKLHNLDKIYFGGFFIRGHPVTMRTITYSINFFSKVRKTQGSLQQSHVLVIFLGCWDTLINEFAHEVSLEGCSLGR